MRRSKKQEVLVGAFVLLSCALLVLLLSLMGGLDAILSDRVTVTAVFRDVQGLQVGDPVYVYGLKCGKVSAIEPVASGESEPVSMRVEMDVGESERGLIRARTLVVIDKSLTGNISVMMKQPRDEAGGPLAEGERLAGSESSGFEAVTERATAVLDEARLALRSVREVVESVQEDGHLRQGLASVAGLTQDLRERLQTLGSSLESSLARVDDTVGSLRSLVEENRPAIRQTLANLEEDSALVRNFLARLDGAPEKLTASLAALESATTGVSDLLVENRAHIDALIEDLTVTSANAANLTSDVKRRPWRLLYRPSIEEQKALELYDAAWAYNLGATELHRSARDLAVHLETSARTGADDGEHREALALALARVRESLERQKEAEELFWARLRAAE